MSENPWDDVTGLTARVAKATGKFTPDELRRMEAEDRAYLAVKAGLHDAGKDNLPGEEPDGEATGGAIVKRVTDLLLAERQRTLAEARAAMCKGCREGLETRTYPEHRVVHYRQGWQSFIVCKAQPLRDLESKP